MKLTNEDVQEILGLLDAASYDVLQIQTARFRLTLRRSGNGGWSEEKQSLASPHLAQAQLAPTAVSREQVVKAAVPMDQSTPGLIEVRASLPGTFYRAPRPGAPPFVEAGTRVESDTVVGIIETMKLMNAVHAGASGEVAEVCVGNAEFVEPGALLMRLRPKPP